MANGRPDFRRDFYRLRLRISRDRRHQDNIASRNLLQGQKAALGNGKQVLPTEAIRRYHYTKRHWHDSLRDGGTVLEIQLYSCRGASG